MQRLSDAIVHSSRWLRECALPLWASSGFDERRDAFEEQLEFSGAPVAGVARRLMVQARQVSVFAAAALSGVFFDGAKVSLRAARSMIDTYFESDGAPGWAFSADQLGRLVDAKRDLYAHAFAIFAIAWAMRRSPSCARADTFSEKPGGRLRPQAVSRVPWPSRFLGRPNMRRAASGLAAVTGEERISASLTFCRRQTQTHNCAKVLSAEVIN